MLTTQQAPPKTQSCRPGAPPLIAAVIGAGFSGTMAAIHLRRHLPPDYEVHLIERSGRFARGVAYATKAALHLLNVRAANMSAFPEDPGHFERWVAARAAAWPDDVHLTLAGIFTTRRLYGRYLRDLLYQEVKASGGAVRLVADEALSLEPQGQGWRISCANGREIEAAAVVLATGNLPASRPCDGVVFHDPWHQAALTGLRPEEPVLIIGTGLTMVDLALTLDEKGFRGPIIALSRRGMLPLPHEPIGQTWLTPDFPPETCSSARRLLRAVRAELRAAQEADVDWRAVVDSLRPITQELWSGLPWWEKRRFLRHLRSYWDVHRHRMAPPAAARIGELRQRGRLWIKRGRFRQIANTGAGASVTLQGYGETGTRTINVQRVIFATGLEGLRSGSGLVARLLRAGAVRLDPQELGLEVTETLAVVNAQGAESSSLWALGPLVRGMFWECLAVPDIRVQARRIGLAVARVAWVNA